MKIAHVTTGDHVFALESGASNCLSNCDTRKVSVIVWEDHIKFISNDLKQNVPYVELCSRKFHKHKTKGIKITHKIEYNNGCASQF